MGGRCLKHKSAACRPPAGLAAEETSPVPAPLGRAAALLPPGAAVPVQGFGALPSPCPGVRPSAVSHSCPFNGVRRSALRSSGLSHRPMGGKAALGGISQWPRSAPPPPSRAAKGASGARRGRPSVRAVREGPQRRRHGRVSAGVGLPSGGAGRGLCSAASGDGREARMRCPPQGAAPPSGAGAAFRRAFEAAPAALPASPPAARNAVPPVWNAAAPGGGRRAGRAPPLRGAGRWVSPMTARGLCPGSRPEPSRVPEQKRNGAWWDGGCRFPRAERPSRAWCRPGRCWCLTCVVLPLPRADIALIGLAVMGQNLILNMNDHGFVVSERKCRAEGLTQ